MTAAPSARPIELLLVEDNPADVRLIREAFKDGQVPSRLHAVGDGEAALCFLRRQQPYQEVPRPDLILLDLNLPRTDGREVLSLIKNDPDLKRIPVVVLTTLDAEEEVVQAYRAQANCYINKPADFDRFVDVVKAVESFWLGTATLPPA